MPAPEIIRKLVAKFEENREGHPRTYIKLRLQQRQIDQLVCELYGLTEDEIRIVEGGRLYTT